MRFKNIVMLAGLLTIVFAFPKGPALSAEKPIVYFGINLRYDPITMYKRYQPMMDYLSNNTPYTFQLRISHDYGETVKHLVDGKTQIASLGDGAVFGAIIQHGAIPILRPLNEEGKPTYRSYFIVSEKSGINTMGDLKGKKIAFGYHHSLTGNLLPRVMLRNSGIEISSLASLINLPKHSAVTKSIIKGEYDAGAVKDVVARIYLKHRLRIIATSAEFPSTPLVARKGTPPELIKAVTDALVKLDRHNSEHRKVLSVWSEEYKNGFVPASLEDYRGTIRLYKSIPLGCGTGCHR